MKILVISDTHGHTDRVIRLLPILTDLDAIIHLGDFVRDAEHLRKYTDVKIISVGGNCDGVTAKTEAIKTIESPFGLLLITHGHLHGAKNGIDKLLYQAAECNAKAVLFGHTHTPFYGVFDGVSLVNPGSISLPHHQDQGTYAILNIDTSGISCALVNYQDPPATVLPKGPPDKDPTKKNPSEKNSQQKKQIGGFLRDILNNSDRF